MPQPKRDGLPFFFGIPAVLWQVLFFYLPLIVLFFSSIIEFSDSGSLTGITLEKLRHFFKPSYFRVILASLTLAISNTLLCFLVAYPLAYFLAIKAKKWRNLLLFFLIVPFWTNFLLHVYAWFFVLERGGFVNTVLLSLGFIQEPLRLLNSVFAIMIMMVYYYLPFMLLPIYSSLEKFDRKLIEASHDLGASHFQTLKRVVLPLTLRGVRSGFLLVFIPSFGEFAIPELMGGDKIMFVGNAISKFILGEETGEYGAAFTVIACFCLLIAVIILNLVINLFIRPGVQSGRKKE